MIVGVMTASLHLQGIFSLKEKRSIVKSVIGRLQSRFNASISEVDHNDSKELAVLGISVVGNDTRFVESQLESVAAFMRRDGRFYLCNVERETFGV
ncbi:MAG: DUF503 domain-containing protein [Sedimentisphaerales bacterium]|nr:DUF503 domain-containing protein [Sedimentisphaerales bacterium]